jgi:hypothetical protein
VEGVVAERDLAAAARQASGVTNGVFVANATAAIANSLASGLSVVGFWARSGSKVVVTNSVSANNGYGFDITGGGQMAISGCTAANSSHGIYSFGTGSTT